ncbi:MAG: hypothetical protein DRP37_00605 [Thermodesulfobacteriota bacterium]|nr:MAG: hypothetical protein DRP37_00605 [Thermodesulfobacteriota bacterium]
MKINITKKEYKSLLDILSIADWILNAHKIGDDPETEEYEKLEQKLNSYAEDMGYGNFVTYDTKLKKFFPTKEFEETSKFREFIDEFENATFWDELLHRLVERDLIKQEGGVKNVMNMNFRERLEKEEPLEKMYATEFEANGLDNIRI